jgi:HEAT repeat protein
VNSTETGVRYLHSMSVLRTSHVGTEKVNEAQNISTLTAVDSLGCGQCTQIVSELVPFLRDDNDAVRYWVAMAIGNLGHCATNAVPALIQALGEKESSSDSKNSASAIRLALKRIGSTGRQEDTPSRPVTNLVSR